MLCLLQRFAKSPLNSPPSSKRTTSTAKRVPRDTYEVLLNLGSVVHSRSVIWARLPPSVPVSAENVHFVSGSRKGVKLEQSRHGEVEVDEDVYRDESSEYTGVRPRGTARLITTTPVAVPCGRAALAGGRGTTAELH